MKSRCGTLMPLLLMLSTAQAGFWGDVGSWLNNHVVQPINNVAEHVGAFVFDHVDVDQVEEEWHKFTQFCNKEWNDLGDWTIEELKELGQGLGMLLNKAYKSLKTEVMLKLGEAVDTNFLGLRDALQAIDDAKHMNGNLMQSFGGRWRPEVTYNHDGYFNGVCDWKEDAQRHPEDYVLKSITVWRQPLFSNVVGLQNDVEATYKLYSHDNSLVSHMLKMIYNIVMSLDHWYLILGFEHEDGSKIWMRKERLVNGIGLYSAEYYTKPGQDHPEFDNYKGAFANALQKYAEVVKKTECTGNHTLADIKQMSEKAATLGHYNVLNRNCQSMCKWFYERLDLGDLSTGLTDDDKPSPNISS